MLTRQGLPSRIGQLEKNIGEVPREAPGLPQSEIAGNEKHHHHKTNYIENIVHVSFSFPSRIGSPLSRQERIVVLPSNKAHWDLKFSDIIQIGVLHLCCTWPQLMQ
jgi:hypothetical protein